ncbi:hypothetical protein J5N97_017576 [Dioscorea zingiberensis]|uniref:Uncharacterized protein n=1 Tax=Dioscorea zingiberensis TaxID=325984 RepID=A0A9D5CLM7_9LILI|nr:hypothetical protein J5N97_017576 [Dioscorea zingiberensis]
MDENKVPDSTELLCRVSDFESNLRDGLRLEHRNHCGGGALANGAWIWPCTAWHGFLFIRDVRYGQDLLGRCLQFPVTAQNPALGQGRHQPHVGVAFLNDRSSALATCPRVGFLVHLHTRRLNTEESKRRDVSQPFSTPPFRAYRSVHRIEDMGDNEGRQGARRNPQRLRRLRQYGTRRRHRI